MHCSAQSGAVYNEYTDYIADKIDTSTQCDNSTEETSPVQDNLLSNDCIEQTTNVGGRTVVYSNVVKNLSGVDGTRTHAMSYSEYIAQKQTKTFNC